MIAFSDADFGGSHPDEREEEGEADQMADEGTGEERTAEESLAMPSSSSSYSRRSTKHKSSSTHKKPKWDDVVAAEVKNAAIKEEILLLKKRKLELEIELLEKKLDPATSSTASDSGITD